VRHSQGRGFLPTILLADDTNSLEQLTEAVGRVDGYLVKPLNHQALLDQIHNLLSVRHYVEAVLAARNEQQAHMLKQVQTLDVLKNAVVRNVSHEMRTPVLQIKSAIALMAEEISGEQPPEVASLHKLLNMATQATARLENTVASITQLAEIQNLKVEPFLLSESVELATRTLQRSWQSRDNQPRIVTYYTENLPPAFGDKRGIAQVLQQLLDNALKFSPDGGPVEVHIAAQDEDTIRVDVRDYGIGIAPDKLDHIFDEFYQIEASSTRRFSGVGIGLTLAKLILEQLGSSIQVESAEGVGSTFSFVLPRAALD
ncbi:MAG: HAMP domain-containing histidine kinase, partial [Anaerolineae bacterium]|nr:HAMP domain-containing histidine kinase [Anaerolineae bacterium]